MAMRVADHDRDFAVFYNSLGELSATLEATV